jgi:Hydrophobic surface binding protein A
LRRTKDIKEGNFWRSLNLIPPSLTILSLSNLFPSKFFSSTTIMKFFATAALLALAVAIVSADVATVKADVAAIDSAVTDLNNKLASDNINYISALGIHNSAQALDKKIQTATTDVTSNTETVTESDAQDIINTLTGTEANVKTATDRLVTLKPKFDSLGVSNLAKQDVAALSTDTDAFGKALVAAAPADLQASAQSLADKFNADLKNAATAYGA